VFSHELTAATLVLFTNHFLYVSRGTSGQLTVTTIFLFNNHQLALYQTRNNWLAESNNSCSVQKSSTFSAVEPVVS